MRCKGSISPRSVLLALPVLAAWIGCSQSSSPETHPVVILGVDDRASGERSGVRLEPERTRRYLERALSGSRYLRSVSELSPDAYRAELAVVLATERKSNREEDLGVYRAIQVELQLHRRAPDGPERLSARGRAFRVQDPKRTPRDEGFDRVLKMAIAKAVEHIDLQIESRQLHAQELLTKLKDKRTEIRLYALRSMRDRRVSELVSQVIRMLSDPDDEVVLEAIGVLVAQRDQRAVIPLIRMSQTRDPVFQLQIITAVAELGGPVARGYLFTLAAGHRSAQIQQRAREGLARIQREEESESAQQVGPAVALPRPAEPDGGSTHRGAK